MAIDICRSAPQVMDDTDGSGKSASPCPPELFNYGSKVLLARVVVEQPFNFAVDFYCVSHMRASMSYPTGIVFLQRNTSRIKHRETLF